MAGGKKNWCNSTSIKKKTVDIKTTPVLVV